MPETDNSDQSEEQSLRDSEHELEESLRKQLEEKAQAEQQATKLHDAAVTAEEELRQDETEDPHEFGQKARAVDALREEAYAADRDFEGKLREANVTESQLREIRRRMESED